MLTDAEVLATFMEPKPAPMKTYYINATSAKGWWRFLGNDLNPRWVPREITTITLNECREIEARLTDEQWREYVAWFQFPPPLWQAKAWLHADAPTKITALAHVLRPLVAPEEQPK